MDENMKKLVGFLKYDQHDYIYDFIQENASSFSKEELLSIVLECSFYLSCHKEISLTEIGRGIEDRYKYV